jgi:hypothetical protein
MNFMWFIYLTDVLPALDKWFGFFFILASVCGAIGLFLSAVALEDGQEEFAKGSARFVMYLTPVWFVSLIFSVLFPNKETMYYMAAAYGAEKVVTSEAAGEIATESFGLLEDYIAKYRKELKEELTKDE